MLLVREAGIGDNVGEMLRAMGHNVRGSRGDHDGWQAIMWDAKERVYYGASELRKDGKAAGY